MRSFTISVTTECAYISGDLEVKEPDTNTQTDQNAYANREALGDVVGISNAKRYKDASKRLKSHSDPHNPIVAAEESAVSDLLPVDKNYANEEGGEKRVE